MELLARLRLDRVAERGDLLRPRRLHQLDPRQPAEPAHDVLANVLEAVANKVERAGRQDGLLLPPQLDVAVVALGGHVVAGGVEVVVGVDVVGRVAGGAEDDGGGVGDGVLGIGVVPLAAGLRPGRGRGSEGQGQDGLRRETWLENAKIY